MKIPTVFFISTRYIYASGGRYLSRVMSSICVLGTALSVAILLCIMSIMNGFELELKSRTLGPGSHLEVMISPQTKKTAYEYLTLIKSQDGIANATAIIESQVLASNDSIFRSITLRGLEPSSKYFKNIISQNIIKGDPRDFIAEDFGIVLGTELADSLGVSTADHVSLTLPQPQISPIGLVTRTKRFKIVGIFKFGLHDPDGNVAFIRSDVAAAFLPKTAAINLVSVVLEDFEESTLVADRIESLSHLKVTDWKDKHKALFRALKIEKLVMFVILFMAVLIAILNMTSILLVNVTSKRKDIGILLSLGISRLHLAFIFFWQGVITGVIGLSAGLCLGAVLSRYIDTIVSVVERILGFKVLSPQIYYISNIPSRPSVDDMSLVAGISLISMIAATAGPALLAAKVDPVKGLRSD